MSGQELNLKFKGLYLSANELGANPDGSMSIADNVVIDFDDLLQSRRGFEALEGSLPLDTDRFERFTNYQQKIMTRYRANKLAFYDDTTPDWALLTGVYADPDTTLAKTRFLQANQNLYATTAGGVLKLDSVTSTPRLSGGIKALDAAAAITGTSGYLPTDNQVAYRMVWGYKDLNDNLILGTVSNRAIAINSSGNSVDVDISFTIPDNVTVNDFYQIYRSPASGGAAIEPQDEMQLVYEANPTASELLADTITITDIVPDSLKGATLYTSPSVGGIAENNDRPPLSWDLTTFRNYTFYANTQGPQRLLLTLIAVGSPDGVQVGDILTIGGVAYTADTAENTATGHFQVITAGTPGQNIADTSQSLVRVINRYATNTTINAFYLSGYNDLPGQMLFEEIALGGAGFAAVASANSIAYRPNLPTTGTTVSSTNDEYKNGLFFSKMNQPEAVPLTNIFFVGSASSPIYRIVALRDSMFILKAEGIYRLTGTDPTSFSIEQFDLTTKLIAPDTAVTLGNEIWMLSDQGVVSVSDDGVQVRSRPIDVAIDVILGRAYNNLVSKSFAVSYETDRKYLLYLPETEIDSSATFCYVFNLFTSVWTRWTRPQTACFVDTDVRKLVVGNALSNIASIERKTYTYTDFIDEAVGEYNVVALDQDLQTLTLDSVGGLKLGDLLFLSASVNGTVTAIDTTMNTVGMSTISGIAISDTLTGFAAIVNNIEWNPMTGENPGRVKQWSEITALFKSSRFFVANFRFRTDLSQSYFTTPVLGVPNGGWGQFPWGGNPWGGTLNTKPLRTYVPQDKQYAAQMTFRVDIQSGYSDWKMLGASLPYNDISFETTN